MPTSKLLLKTFLGLNLLMLAACNLPAPQSRNDSEETNKQGAATFFISDVKGDALKATTDKGSALPQSKTFNFTVCVKDRAQSKALIGHPFRVEEIGKQLKTDEKGCLNWSEEVPFNYSSTPQYLQWTRRITATGLHKGTRTAEFAINPWSENDNSAAVVNTEEHQPKTLVSDNADIQAALRGENSRNEKSATVKNNLWVNDIRLQSTEQKFTTDGVNLNFDLAITPQLLMSTLSGEKTLRDFNQGSFKVKIYLLHSLTENNKNIRVALAESEVQTSAIYGKSLFIKAAMSLAVIPTRGQLILALDLSSVDDPTNIGNFQGVYSIGEYDQLKGSVMLKLMSVVTESKDFQISDFVNTKLTERLQQHSDAYVKPQIEIMPLEFKYVRVGKETTSEREIVYNVKACLKNGLEQKTTRGFTFNVTGFRQSETEPAKTVKIMTDNSSCINWDDTLVFKYYECQKFMKGFIDVENKDLALKQRINIAINPWDSLGTFARDLRYVDNQEQILTDCKKENVLPSTLSLRSFSFTTLSYGYEIDHQLNMQVKKKLRFKLDAGVSIFSDMAKGRMENAQKLRPGVYLLKGALIKNRDYYSQKSYVSSFEKLVTSIDGDIKTDIEFKTADLKALSDRNTLVLELDPVQEEKVTVDKDGQVTPKEKVGSLDEVIDSSTGLYKRSFSAATNINMDKDAQDLTAMDMSVVNQYMTMAELPKVDAVNKSLVREYINYGKKLESERQQAQLAQSDMSAFVKNNDLKAIAVNNPKSYEDLRGILGGPPTQMSDQKMQTSMNQLISTGKLDSELTKGLCAYWFRSFIAKDLWDTYGHLALINCGVRAGQPERLFTIEKRLFVKELGGYKYKKGFNAGIIVGNNITLTKSQTHSNNRTKNLTFNIGLSHKFADIFSIGVTGSYMISQSDTSAEATANSTSVNTNITLAMQQNIFQLNFKRYQECVIVKANPKLFMKDGLYETALSPRLTTEQKVDVATRGLMICTGTDNTTPKTREESYYFLNQEATTAQTQDNGDERNRNFFIALRGEKEFQRLMYFMKGELKTPQTATRETDDHKTISGNLEKLFSLGHANIPGSYNDTH
jgi:hypothetical protein